MTAPAQALADLRAKRPLVQNITNAVVTNFTANVLLALGASPAMVHAEEEVAEFVAISDALVLNIGTLDAGQIKSMKIAAAAANRAGKPWVLDPVGAGATKLRTQTSLDLLALRPAALRANAAETMALAGARAEGQKGVDSSVGADAAIEAARALAADFGAVVAVTGETDRIVSSSGVDAIAGGHAAIQLVTGTGCASTAILGAFLAVAPPREAAIAALTVMKRAAERGMAGGAGPGTLAARFIDALASITPDDLS